MSWQEEFKAAVVEAVFENGYVELPTLPDDASYSDTSSRYYGGNWDYDLTAHRHECSIGEYGDITESEWSQFAGTFDDADTRYGITVVMTCACGKIKNRRVTWEAKFGEVLRKLVGLDVS